MRLAGLLLLAILFSCLSVHADDSEPGDIAVPSIAPPNMDMPKPLVSSPTMDITETELTPLIKPRSNLNQASNQTGTISSNPTQASQIQEKGKTMNVSGRWSIILSGETDLSLDITLWQSAGASGIMGFGTLTDEGTKNSMTARGSVSAQELKIIAKLAAPEHANLKYDECDLDLHSENGTISGNYVLRSSGQFLERGNATVMPAPNL